VSVSVSYWEMGQVPLRHEENAINQEANRINRIENRTCMLLMDILKKIKNIKETV
jgi:hypothetical protein